ncbi:VacJ family lipoprotein [Thalassotalea euphylliae]|uniref:VacJ family lipoprotein n=1 Tax=Thalassotalea euphylliae TaxID=1655234 RepID=A0A3E0TNF6_9GAMM|nr:VacJ family lipoprotein [Thalassotalea euphylliae]REL26099.1 VacJ family lipoprotein [Thalassotalea euphylliae]
MNYSCYRVFSSAFSFPTLKALALVSVVALSGCSSTSQVDNDPKDPLEPVNRASWTFTWDYADKYVLKPAATAYTEYTPTFLRTGLHNMALNLNEPSSFINNVLQGKFTDAGKSAGRFILNSTVGILGFFDPASDFGWTGTQEEFGEVLAVYGVGDGPYLVIPALGPSSVRDEAGDFVDRYYWPLAVIDFWPNVVRSAIIGLEARASLTQQEQLINEAIDPYEFVKQAYFQNMEYRVYDGNPPIKVNEDEEAELDAYLDELDEE